MYNNLMNIIREQDRIEIYDGGKTYTSSISEGASEKKS